MERVIVKLDGGLASNGEVPAFSSLESLHGFAQASMMVLHFAKNGEIRRRGFKELDTDFRLVATKEGSFEFLFEFNQFAPYFIDAYGKGMANASWELLRSVFNRAIGLQASDQIEEAQDEGAINPGDLGALVQATEPAIRKAHSVVNHGSSNISIFVEGNDNKVFLDASSKEYMHENIFNDETRSQRFIVTSYDGRNRTGRLFDLEKEQAFTFDLQQEANRSSLEVIVNSARAYALREKGKFDEDMEAVCVFTSVDAPDGRTKRLKIFGAAKSFDELQDDMGLDSIDKVELVQLSPPPDGDDVTKDED